MACLRWVSSAVHQLCCACCCTAVGSAWPPAPIPSAIGCCLRGMPPVVWLNIANTDSTDVNVQGDLHPHP